MAARYVIDASILGHYFGTDTYTPHATHLIRRMTHGDTLYGPEFCLLECTNIFWKAVRFHGMPVEQAIQLTHELVSLGFQVISVSELLNDALAIGVAHQLAVYDSLYIALALSLDCPLVTLDDRQQQAAIAQGANLKPITDFSE